MEPKQVELLMNGKSVVVTFNEDTLSPTKTEDTGMAHITENGVALGNFPYKWLTFKKLPFGNLPSRD